MARAGELGADQALAFLREIDYDQHAPAGPDGRSGPRGAAAARSSGRRIAVLGAAFKPDSDDIRDSPALNVAAQMQLQGAVVVVTDPKAMENAQRPGPDLWYVATAEEAAERGRLVLLLTEWERVPQPGPGRARPGGRAAADPGRPQRAGPAGLAGAGWTYRALGRK